MWCSITKQAHPLIWPAHPIAAPPSLCSAGRRISSLRRNIFVWPAHPHRCAAISSAGWRIATPPYHIWLASPCGPIIFWPAHPIAAPPLPVWAGASDRLFWLAHPIAAPTYHISAGASNRCATIAYLGWRIPLPILAGASPCRNTIAYLGWRIPLPI